MMPTATESKVKINQEQRMYVIPCSGGHSCWGFDNCFDEAYQLADRLARPLPQEVDRGTMKVYDYHQILLGLVREHRIDLGTWFHRQTPKAVKEVLEAARFDRMKVRVFYGETDPAKENYGLSWLEEHDVYGYIGRSTGFLKVPLLVEPGEDGGCALLDSCIIKIQGPVGVTLYQHEAFRLPNLEIKVVTGEHPIQLLADGKVHAAFKDAKKAARLLAFLKGERVKP